MLNLKQKYELLSEKIEPLNKCINGFYIGQTHLNYTPVEIFLEVSHGCNINCKMCASHRSSQVWPGESFTEELFQKVESILNRTLVVNMHGFGEPLINRHFDKFVETAKKNENYVEFFTNGVALNRSKAEMLVKNQVDLITLSFDGATKDTFEHIREGANFNRVIENFMLLDNIKTENGAVKPRVEINFVGMQRNFNELPEMPAIAKKIGAGAINVKSLVTYDFVPFTQKEKRYYIEKYDDDIILKTLAAAQINNIKVDFRQYYTERAPQPDNNADAGTPAEKTAADNIATAGKTHPEQIITDDHTLFLLKPRKTCPQPWTTLYVSTSGNVSPCCFYSSDEEYTLGNINDQPIEDIWNNTKFQKLREMISQGAYPQGCRHCIQFNLRPNGISFFQLFKDIIEEDILSDEFKELIDTIRHTDLIQILGYKQGYNFASDKEWLIYKNNDKEIVVSDDFNAWPVIPDSIIGNIDSVSFQNEQLLINGWMVHAKDKIPPDSIEAVIDNKILFSGRSHLLRDDVSEIHGPQAIRSGFTIKVPQEIPAWEKIHQIRLFGLFDKDAGELPHQIPFLLNEQL